MISPASSSNVEPDWLGHSTFEWVGMSVGVIGALVTIAALVYAFRAARQASLAAQRAEQLLFRTVVVPFRALDVAHARLTTDEVKVLLHIYQGTDGGQRTVSRDKVSGARLGNVSIQLLGVLEREGWINQEAGRVTFNPDRASYMQFKDQAGEGAPG